MEVLEKLIDENYSKLSKQKVLDIAQEQANHLMIKTNSLLQANLYNWDNEKLKEYSYRVQSYANIISYILSVKNNEYNSDFKKIAKINANDLITLIRKETEDIFLNSSLNNQQNIIEEIYIPNLLLKWVINNY
ncbi:hypothetical protein [Apibacter adventoris]|uniref:Uncharacterized protein n=1 Tax=Apibacter adventoris TaxID=1679466 RepID=A0A2S8A861_9FLAO|nr:hypothetical protein [Apibacter adventoris]PQL90752.1 hypothetical protein C4S77_09860 [Apibacter adventoris]